jgi:hypothetical protein
MLWDGFVLENNVLKDTTIFFNYFSLDSLIFLLLIKEKGGGVEMNTT